MVVNSESRLVCNIVGPYLLEIRLLRIIGFFVQVSNDPILPDWHEVVSSNFFLRFQSLRYLIFTFSLQLKLRNKVKR